MDIKQVYIPIAKITFEYFPHEAMFQSKTIRIATAGIHKFPINKTFNEEGHVYDLFKFNGKFAIYRCKKGWEKQQSKYVVWGISKQHSDFDETLGHQVHTYEWADPVFLNHCDRNEISYVSPPYREGSSMKLWNAYDLTTFKPDVWETKFFQYQDKIRIKEEDDYKRKQEKYAKENRAVCGACERYIERWDEGNRNGVIYDHGFQQLGFRSGPCVGSRLQVWEKSTEGKVAFIKMVENERDHLLNKKPNEETVLKLKALFAEYVAYEEELSKLYKTHGDRYKEDVRYYDRRGNPFSRWINWELKIDLPAKDQPVYLDQLRVKEDTTLSQLLFVWNNRLVSLNQTIEKEQKKVDNWSQQLTAKERKEAQ
mgnify:FL=1